MIHTIQNILMIFVLVGGALYVYVNRDEIPFFSSFLPDTPIMHVGDIPIRIEIVSTEEDRARGLGGRNELGDVDGMLFVFPQADYHGIWMKDMRFPIDIIWIDENLRIISIDKGIVPQSYPRVYRPPLPAKYVVETNMYFTDTFGIGLGQEVRIPLTTTEW